MIPKSNDTPVTFLGLTDRAFGRVQAVGAGLLVVFLLLGWGAYQSGNLNEPREPLFTIAVLGGLVSIALIFLAGLCMAFRRVLAKRAGRD